MGPGQPRHVQGVFHVDDAGTVEVVLRPATPTNPVVVRTDSQRRPAATSGSARGRTSIASVGRAPHVSRLPVTLPDEVGPIVAVPDGTFWVASRSGDVRRVNADRVLEQVTLPGPVVSISMAPDGTLWAGGAGEIFHLPAAAGLWSGSARRRGCRVAGSATSWSIADGTIWIATYGGGLGRLRKGRLTRLTVTEGLPDNALSRLIDDGQGRLWLSTNRGVAVLSRRDRGGAGRDAARC